MHTTDKRPLKVFLCHASTDKPKVRELYRYLKKRGIQPWFDEEDLVGGQDWQVEIPKALATSDAIIICLTKNSVDKEGYIQKEIKFALDKALEMPEGRIFLIPVKFEECEVPFTLSRYQWVDLAVESGYAKMMKALKFRASQLERSTVEVSKKDVEEENLAREKKESETAERAEQELKEALAKQYYELKEKATLRYEKNREKSIAVKPKIGGQIAYWFGGFVVLVVGIIFLSSLNNTPSIPQPTPENTQTQTLATLPQDTIKPSATVTQEPTSNPTNTMTPAPNWEPTSLPTEITDAKGVSMVLVPEGEFVMGSEDYAQNERPAHTVFLDSFYIDKFEVTNSIYKLCEDAGVCWRNYGLSNSSKGDNYPVVSVSWDEAKIFCEWRSANLPTEAQWEKAARGTDGRTYPWGEGINCNKASYARCDTALKPVGSFIDITSPYGVYDMAGSVNEWVADWYSENYYQISPTSNPLGPESGEERVYRGGAYDYPYYEQDVRTSRRFSLQPYSESIWIGFRCAKVVTP